MQRVHYSRLEFRLDPSDARNALFLGFAFGFHTERFWAVAMATVARVPSQILDVLDPLSRSMIENRSDVISHQIGEHFNANTRPEDVLEKAAHYNFSSFFMSPVENALLDMSIDVSMQKIAEDFVFTLFRAPIWLDSPKLWILPAPELNLGVC